MSPVFPDLDLLATSLSHLVLATFHQDCPCYHVELLTKPSITYIKTHVLLHSYIYHPNKFCPIYLTLVLLFASTFPYLSSPLNTFI